MARPRHYSPTIRRDLVTKLYFRAKAEGTRMTKLVDRLLDEALAAVESMHVAESPPSSPAPKPSE